jgi:hypothetical protein
MDIFFYLANGSPSSFETSVYLLQLDATSQKIVITIVTVLTTSNLEPNFVKQIKLCQIKWAGNVEHTGSMRNE